MTMRFHYALAQVLSTREWRRDRLMRQVAAADREAVKAQRLWNSACTETDAAMAAWEASCAPGAMFTPELLQRHAHHAGLRRSAQEKARHEWETLTTAHRLLQAELQGALHAVEGLERHRDGARRGYLQASLQAEYRASDEQWIASSAKGDQK